MKLYHGTSMSVLDSILTSGLRPRGDAPGSWESYPSRDDMVYLTTAYPFYFALHTECDLQDEGNTNLRVAIEIDSTRLDKALLYPDEDFLAQLIATNNGTSIEQVHDAVRANLVALASSFHEVESGEHASAWEISIHALTTCCYKGVIPRAAMTRYCVFDYSLRPLLATIAYNEGPYLGGPHEQYRQFTQWMFGNRRSLPRFIPTRFISSLRPGDKWLPRLQHPNFRLEERSRVGITVVNL